MNKQRDEFLSEEDLDLANLPMAELLAWWDLWLLQAQATNDVDAHLYAHGVFLVEPHEDAPTNDLPSQAKRPT